MPGPFSETPGFTSGYYGEDVDNYMTVSVSGPEISGSVNTGLRDQDSLILTMKAPDDLFPRRYETGTLAPVARLAALGFGLLAIVYWMLRLRWQPVRAVAQAQAPVGVGPGGGGVPPLRQESGLSPDGGVLGTAGLPDHPCGPGLGGDPPQADGHGQRAQRL